MALARARPAPIGEILLRPRPLGLLLGAGALLALAVCLTIFDPGFLRGTSAYWDAPRGIVPNGWADIPTALSGYDYYARGDWTLPLFANARLGAPEGTNIIFTDSIPVVALLGRLWFRATGALVNPYGAWTAFCFVASALSMTGLVASLGQRGIAAALMASVAGLCMPALLARWGHMSLMGQWEIPLALIIYLRARGRRAGRGLVAAGLLLAWVALWTNSYLFVMVAGILAAALMQAATDRRLRAWRAAALFLGSVAFFAALVALSGHVATRGPLAAADFGSFSMNVLSPFIPQFSALMPFLGSNYVDGSGEQYEGFGYLGAGLLLLLIMALPWLGRAAPLLWRRHAWLALVLLAFTAFAISNEVYVGAWHAASIPLPAPVLAFAGIFRSSGRFFWPAMYMLTALVIAGTASLWGRAGGWLLLIACVLQFADTAPLRTAFAHSIAGPADLPLPAPQWRAAIRQHDFVRVVPAYLCLPDPRGPSAQTALELQSLAARENVATNTVYAARHREDCAAPVANTLAPGELRVYLSPEAGRIDFVTNANCRSDVNDTVCSRRLDMAALTALRTTH